MKNIATLKNGKKVIIRQPQIEDAEDLLIMLQDCVATSDFLLLVPAETMLTMEQERAWLSDVIADQNTIMIVAINNDKIIGNAELRIGPVYKQRHRAMLGITIIEEWRNLGLGTVLINTLITIARKNENIEVISLEVFASNRHAITLYERMGFQKEAQIKNAFKQVDDTYVDNIIMTLRIK